MFIPLLQSPGERDANGLVPGERPFGCHWTDSDAVRSTIWVRSLASKSEGSDDTLAALFEQVALFG